MNSIYVPGGATDIVNRTNYEIALQDYANERRKLYYAQLAANNSGTYSGNTSGGAESVNPRENTTENTTIMMADYDKNKAGHVVVIGTAGNDNFVNHGNLSTISGGAGNDFIENWENYVSISGGAGDDTIQSDNFYSVALTINGGAGDDSIKISSDKKGNSIQYSNGDGNDTVDGWNSENTLYIAGGNYTRETLGNDVLVNVGAGSLLIKGVYSKTLDIVTVPAGTFGTGETSSYANYTTTNYSTTDYSLTDYNDYYYVYTGGNQMITDYEGEQIFIGMLPTGLNFIGEDFHFYNGTDELTVTNVMDMVIDFRDGYGNEFAKAYSATNPGVIDGRAMAGFEYIVGSAWGEDTIFAGDGGSNLWGNVDNASDILVGGNNFDKFFFGRNNGDDIIINSSSSDEINLYDFQLGDIIASASEGNALGLGFNTGDILVVQGTDNLSAKFNLADGSSYRFNHATQSWQGA